MRVYGRAGERLHAFGDRVDLESEGGQRQRQVREHLGGDKGRVVAEGPAERTLASVMRASQGMPIASTATACPQKAIYFHLLSHGRQHLHTVHGPRRRSS